MDNIKIYCPMDGHTINFSNASNFYNDSISYRRRNERVSQSTLYLFSG